MLGTQDFMVRNLKAPHNFSDTTALDLSKRHYTYEECLVQGPNTVHPLIPRRVLRLKAQIQCSVESLRLLLNIKLSRHA